MSGERNLITSQDRVWAVAYCSGRSFFISTDIEGVGVFCFLCAPLSMLSRSVPTKHSHPHSIISIQNRSAVLAQTCSPAGTAAVHLLATREGGSGHGHSYSKPGGLQQVMEDHAVMFLTAGWPGLVVHFLSVGVKWWFDAIWWFDADAISHSQLLEF